MRVVTITSIIAHVVTTIIIMAHVVTPIYHLIVWTKVKQHPDTHGQAVKAPCQDYDRSRALGSTQLGPGQSSIFG